MQQDTYREVLEKIHQLMEDSLTAYRNYIQNGKKFREAVELRKCNSEMILLLESDHIINDTSLKDAGLALLEHYTIWRNIWDECAAKWNPQPDDLFVFPNEHRFPKWAAEKFESAWQNEKEKD